jgi:folate-binding protein YgfZ
LLKVVGEDALAFLQGQFSQDLLNPTGPSRVSYGLWLNHKGRIMADSFALVAGPAEVWLVSYFSAAAGIREHLEKHIIADDVTVEDQTTAWTGLAVGGVGAAERLQDNVGKMLVSLPSPGEFVRVGAGFVFRGRRDGGESWDWVAPTAEARPNGSEQKEIASMALELIRLSSGVPAVPMDLGPGDLPAEGGLDQVAVSYNKGCYLGQEVMARLRTGKIRRRLHRMAGGGSPPEGRPTLLFQGGRRVGELRSAVADGKDGWVGFAMLTLQGLDPAGPLATGQSCETSAQPTGAAAAIRLLDVP